MIYEFIGLPGAGKSYLSRRLSEEKRLSRVESSGRLERLIRSVLFTLRHPFFTLRLMKVFIRENRHDRTLLRHKLSTVLVEVFAREHKARRGTVVETGFFQLFLSLFERPIEERDLSHFFGWLKKRPYRVCIVEASLEVRMRRMSERRRIPRAGLQNAREREAWFNLLEHNFAVLKKSIIRHCEHEVITNN